ncbi:MAG TPA: ATP-binding protein [Thermoanaerobaculia bacterium]|nr:ATP-binding protein [Thermoanaerobaculia bacterium]
MTSGGAEERHELAELLYALSHDLGAPLRVIDGFSEALLEELQNERQDALPPDALEYLTTIRGAVSRMNELFDAIRQLHRVSQAPLRRVDLDVTALAETISSELRAAEPSRDVRFAVEPGLAASADPALFRTALSHLLRNAWKFTAKRTDAVITVGREDEVTLFVRDNGAGFDPAGAGRMFTPFQRFHPAGEYEGLGIGLAVVRRIVHRHGGRVRARGALQQGMTVSMELPWL